MAPQSTSAGAGGAQAQHTNRLVSAKSPYLIHHANDPVDWYEWGNEAFQEAQKTGKVVFLSIGYSSCHWCHVLQKESFQNDEIARQLNKGFVSIKVDREERPDVDAAYMQFVMAISGHGGWPLSVFMTPQGEPIFGGTYFPPETFTNLLDKLATMWEEDRERCLTSAASISEQLRSQTLSGSMLSNLPPLSVAPKAYEHWARAFDDQYGGFGQAPKFPSVSMTHHLLHRFADAARRGKLSDAGAGEAQAKRAMYQSLFTLRQIARGGIADHLGGGIARYSVDRKWMVPHFEKMLYDQGQLLTSYIEAIQLVSSPSASEELKAMTPEFEVAAQGIITYLSRDLSDPDGGLYAAEDADSLPTRDSPKTREGAFYVWTKDDIDEALGGAQTDAARLVCAHFGIVSDGNIDPQSDPHGELTGMNMLHSEHSLAETAQSLGMPLSQAEEILASAKQALLARRNQRPRPHLDDKVIAAWSGLAISGLAKASEVLAPERGGSQALSMAQRAAAFVLDKLYDPASGRLRRSYREGPGPWAFSSDYAFFIQGLLDLHGATLDDSYIARALALQEKQDSLFWDDRAGGYFIGPAGSDADHNLLMRMKEEQDGAEPSASSVSAHNLFRLLSLVDDASVVETMTDRLHRTIKAGGVILQRAPHALGTLVSAALSVQLGARQIVVVGTREQVQPYLSEIRRRFLPDRALIHIDTTDLDRAKESELYNRNAAVQAILDDAKLQERGAHVHLCEDFACGLPIKSAQELAAKLDA